MTEPETWLVLREHEGDIGFIAQHIKGVVRLKAKRELEAGVGGITDIPWLVEKHLSVVESRVDWILDNCKEADGVDRNETLIAVYAHDFGRLMGWDDYHHAIGALKTKQWLLDNGLSEEVAGRIFNAVLRHRAEVEFSPVTPLDKVIASADALSHFDGCEEGNIEDFLKRKGFWYLIWAGEIKKGSSEKEILGWSLKKMKVDALNKQGFEESRERAKKEYEFLKDNASEIIKRIKDER